MSTKHSKKTEIVDGSVVTENRNTCAIYKITNIENNKIYIGKANSFVKNGKQGIIYYSGEGRLKRHVYSAENGSEDCPKFYKAIRKYGKDSFKVEILKVCPIKDGFEEEEKLILEYESDKRKKGYNYFAGTKKPTDKKNKEEFENKKAESNRNRCKDGSLRRSNASANLPPNINIHKVKGVHAGYKYQFKDSNGKLWSGCCSKSKYTMEEKLEMCIEQYNEKRDEVFGAIKKEKEEIEKLEDDNIIIINKKKKIEEERKRLIKELSNSIYMETRTYDDQEDLIRQICEKSIKKININKKKKENLDKRNKKNE
jgi:hypothetical protein